MKKRTLIHVQTHLYIIFVYEYLCETEDSWVPTNSTSTFLHTIEQESTSTGLAQKCRDTSIVDSTVIDNLHTSTVETKNGDDTLRTVGKDTGIGDIRINEEVQDVPEVIDTFHPTGTGTEVDRKSIAVQEVHGEFAESMELNFINGQSETEYEYNCDRDSESYIAADVEKLDNLNFDDSDVSIDDDDHIKFL